MGSKWLHTEEQLVRTLSDQGKSALEIAIKVTALGHNTRSRSSVIGYCNRSRIVLKGRGGRKVTPSIKRAERGKYQRVSTPKNYVKEPAVHSDDVKRKTLMELQFGDCKWPIGVVKTPNFGFCGMPRNDHASYCDIHAKRSVKNRGK